LHLAGVEERGDERQGSADPRRHAQLVRESLQRLGSDVSSVKSGFASVMGTVESFSTKFFGDELLKNMLMDHASEHFEIACYRALIEAANQAGEPEIAKTCTAILTEEENMAEWLRQNLGVVTRNVLARTATAR
jgi:ferritin-like metal-binding protein YciE